MARNPLSPAELVGPDFVGATPPDMAAQEIAVREKLDMADEVLAAGIDLGRIEAFDFMLTVSTSAILVIYEKVQKSKAWRYIRNPKNADGQHFTSIEEFCEVKLGKSYTRLREISSNRKTLGLEAFEQAERLGLGQRDYNILKALPAPKQEIIKEALAEETSKEDLQKLIRELSAADQREIEALEKRAESAEADLEASRHLARERADEVADLRGTLHRVKKTVAEMPPADVAANLRQELMQRASMAEVEVRSLRQFLVSLRDHAEQHGGDHVAVMSGAMAQVHFALLGIVDEFDLVLTPLTDREPVWLKEHNARTGTDMGEGA